MSSRFIYNCLCVLVHSSSPGGVGYVDASQIDALAADYEERGEAEQGHAAADHGQLGRLSGAELQLLDDVAAKHDAHAGAGYDYKTCDGDQRQCERVRWRKNFTGVANGTEIDQLICVPTAC